MTDSQLSAIRCSGCRRALAWGQGAPTLRNAVYCSQWCAEEPPATPMSARNDLWAALRAGGATPVSIARQFGVAHSLVYKTLARLAQ